MGTLQISRSDRRREVLVGLASGLALALAALPAAGATPLFGPASPLASNAAIDAGSEGPPVVAAGGNRSWVAVWDSNDPLGGTLGADYDVLFARTSDGGATWSTTAPLDPLATSDVAADNEPTLASDRHGTWVAVWRSNRLTGSSTGDLDLLVSRSTDDGITWSSASLLHAQLASDDRSDDQPALVTDGQGRWIVAWRSTRGESDLLFARSDDGGATWSAPAPLNQNAASDSGNDQRPALATDGAGAWVAVWASSDTLGGTIGSDEDILFARSADGGSTWSAPRALHANASADAGQDNWPAIASDGAGGWLVAWQSSDGFGGTLGNDLDVVVARSTDAGATWSAPAPVHAYAAGDVSRDAAPAAACGAPRHCAVAWQSNENLGNAIGADVDVLFAMTDDGGATWGAPAALDPRAALDTGADFEPSLVADGRGSWTAVWRSQDSFGGAIGTDWDPLVAVGLEPSVCGDGVPHLQELCEDGNVLAGDGCRADCTLELCGDAIIDPGETCDDGNATSGDGCRADCTLELCGDAIVDPAETCDDGNATSGDGCRAACTLELCGDAIVDAGETCDDGNATSGDGCDAVCRVEEAPPAEEPPASLLELFDAAVTNGTLVGSGRRSLAPARLRVLRWWIAAAERQLDGGHRQAACALLSISLERIDGRPRPPDLARGPAAAALADRIEEIVEDTGCRSRREPRGRGDEPR